MESKDLEDFVDELLRDRQVSPSSNEVATVLLDEVKGLFDQLTTALPNQLAAEIGEAGSGEQGLYSQLIVPVVQRLGRRRQRTVALQQLVVHQLRAEHPHQRHVVGV